MSEARIAVADGRQVASSGDSDDKRPSVELLASVVRSLERFGYDVIVILDDELKLQLEKSDSCSWCLEKVTLSLAPDGVDPDSLLLTLADETGASVVSNESFDEYRSKFPWIEKRRIPYRVFSGVAYLDPEELMGVF